MTEKLKMEQRPLSVMAEKVQEMCPEAVTREGKIDFDVLKSCLSTDLAEDTFEKYDFTWVGKNAAKVEANRPIQKTLRPIIESSKNWADTKNIICVGDNLDVLKLLQESYLGKIDLVYIDPPYNTGTNMVYSNDFSDEEDVYLLNSKQKSEEYRLVSNPLTAGRHHSRWLSMIYPRIKLARNLLTDQGFCVLAMDNSEIENLIKVCDEIFGESNRVGIVTVVHKPEGRNQEKFFGTSNEYALFYAKNKSKTDFQNVILDPKLEDKFNLSDQNEKYRLQNFIRMTDGKLALREKRPKFWYPIYVDVNNNVLSTTSIMGENVKAIFPITKFGVEMSWKVLPDSAQQLIDAGKLVFNIDKDGFITIEEKIQATQVIKTHWVRKEYNAIQYGTKIVNDIIGANIFDFPKSLYLIEDIIKLTTKDGDTVLDLFGGSGTTGHAIMDLAVKTGIQRKYIVVQLDEPINNKPEAKQKGYETIDQVTIDRIRKTSEMLQQENKDSVFDGGFRVLKVDSTNMKDIYYKPSDTTQSNLLKAVDNIKNDRSDLDLLFGVMVDCGLQLDMPIETKTCDGKTYYVVNHGDMIACFEQNISEKLIYEIANMKPECAVFRDSSFAAAKDKVNVSEIFKNITGNEDCVKVL